MNHPLVDNHPYARRVRLHPAPPDILWAGHTATDGARVRLRHQRPRPAWSGYPSGMCPPDVKRGLGRLSKGLSDLGFDLACNCLGRDPEQDAEFRGPGGKAAHMPGAWRSDAVGWHLSGRAIDVTLPGNYKEPPTPERLELHAALVSVGEPLGWFGIAPVGTYDDWHFEFRGPWTQLAQMRGAREGALGALLDVGGFRDSLWEWRAVQAQLWRLGYYKVGALDGNPGVLTYDALDALGAPHGAAPAELLPQLYDKTHAAFGAPAV